MTRIARQAIIASMAGLCLATALVRGASASPPTRVIYPSAGLAHDDRGNYYVSLLKLTLSKADEAFDVEPSGDSSGILRAFARIAAHQGVDVVWAPPTRQLDQDFLRIRIPLDKGILGWRLFLINRRDEPRFNATRTLDQLKALEAGQVSEWVDTQILRANGLPVVEAMQYKDLFKMLAADRFRYLPRGIGEIQAEARNYAALNLVIEPHLALHYPMCAYFFVARTNTRLAQQIEQGLRRSLNDGSFERLFQQFNGAAIKAANLNRRRVFELRNPAAPTGPDSARSECLASADVIGRGK